MHRPWFETGVAKAVQEVIDTVQRIFGPELPFQDPLNVPTPKRAHPIVLTCSCLEPTFERLLVIPLELGRLTRSWTLPKTGPALVAIPVNPLLNERSAPIKLLHDPWSRQTLQRQENGSVAVPLLGVAFKLDHPTQLGDVLLIVN